MRMPKRLSISLASLALLALAACGSSNSPAPESQSPAVEWQLQGLEPLGGGFVYEGWVIANGAPVSTGRFNVDSAGVPETTSFTLDAATRDQATAFVLTIEPTPDPDPAPSNTKILGGDFSGGQADLSIAHAAALGNDFLSATGLFILATPTSASTADESQGIWFLDPSMGPGAGLSLPTLPAGWAYEGWVVAGSPISTGRFTDPAMADSDMAGPAAGIDAAPPPFPGQDFVSPATNLIGAIAVISVEPEPDDSPMPFALKPLVLDPIGAPLAPAVQSLSNNAAASAPSGTATLR